MRNVSAYVKILSLAALIGILYWRDLIVLWQVALSAEWIVFTLTIASLIFVFLYQRRRALKTLVLISKNSDKRGAVFLIFAITLYIFGAYTRYVLWFHLCSLILFIISYLMLRFDGRIPRILFMPFTALLFIIPSPIEMRLFEVWNASLLITFIVVVIFLAYIVKDSRFWRSRRVKAVEGVEPCPLCQFPDIKKEAFCPHCGKYLSPPKPALTKFATTKFFILLLVVSILTLVYIPTFTLVDQRAAITLYAPHGAEDQSILYTPQGWILDSSVRLTDYEGRYREDFVILNTYTSEKKYAENKSSILLEIGSQLPYLMGYWWLPGWNRTRQDFSLRGIPGRYIILRNGTHVMTVLYWEMKLLFKIDSTYLTKYAGVSIAMNFTEPMSEAEAFNNLAQLREMGIFILDGWDDASRWTTNAWSLNEIYRRFRDVFFTVVGVVGIFLFAWWARAKDDEASRLAENAFFLPKDETILLAAISTVKEKEMIGETLFNAYKRLTEVEEDINRFYEKLNNLLRLGFLKRDYVLKNCELIMVWRKSIL